MLLSMTSGQKSLSQWTKCKRRNIPCQRGGQLKRNMGCSKSTLSLAARSRFCCSQFSPKYDFTWACIEISHPKNASLAEEVGWLLLIGRALHAKLMFFPFTFPARFSMKMRASGVASLLPWLLPKCSITWEPLRNL